MHFDAFQNSPYVEKASEEMDGRRVTSDGREENVNSGHERRCGYGVGGRLARKRLRLIRRPIVRFWSAISTLIGAAASPRGIENQPPVAQLGKGGERQPVFKPYI